MLDQIDVGLLSISFINTFVGRISRFVTVNNGVMHCKPNLGRGLIIALDCEKHFSNPTRKDYGNSGM